MAEELKKEIVTEENKEEKQKEETIQEEVITQEGQSSEKSEPTAEETEKKETQEGEDKKKPTLQLEYTYADLKEKTLAELQKIGKELGLSRVKGLKKGELIKQILQKEAEKHGLRFIEGVLDIRPEGYGFLRYAENYYAPSPQDTYVPPNLIKKLGLRPGDEIVRYARPPR